MKLKSAVITASLALGVGGAAAARKIIQDPSILGVVGHMNSGVNGM